MGVLVDLGVNQKLVPGSESKVIMDFSRLCEEDCILLWLLSPDIPCFHVLFHYV